MDNREYYFDEINNNRNAYFIDSWEGHAYKFTPQLGWKKAFLKCRNSQKEVVVDATDSEILWEILGCNIATAEEYKKF